MKDIIGLVMELASLNFKDVMGNVMKGMSCVVLIIASGQTKCKIIKIAMDVVFQIMNMKETTGIAMEHAHPKVFHAKDNASKGLSYVAEHV